MKEAFPLNWPVGYKRTHPNNRTWSKFKQTMDRAQSFLRSEINRMGGTGLIVSTNIPVRNDGGLYVDWMNRKIDDPGVAVYFKYKGKDVSLCCDKYQKVWENIYALGKGIEALRAIERYEISEFLERAFTGFKELPMQSESISINWWSILELNPDASSEQIKTAYRRLSMKYHPDNQQTGNAEKFMQVKGAYDQAFRSTQTA